MPADPSGGGGGNAPNDDCNLTFVVTTNPYDASSAANRKQVRSIAALKSWPKRRRNTFEQLEGSTSARGGFILEQRPSTTSDPGWETGTKPVSRQPTRKRLPSAAKSNGLPAAIPKDSMSEPPLFEKCTRAANEGGCNCVHCRFERAISSYPSPDHPQSDPETSRARGSKKRKTNSKSKAAAAATAPTSRATTDQRFISPPESPTPSPFNRINNVGRAEPFNCYHTLYHPWFDRILHHSASDQATHPTSTTSTDDESPR